MANKNFLKFYEKYMSIIGPAGSIMFYLQAYKIFKLQSAQDISGLGFLISFIGLSSWLFYGFLIKDKPLIISNFVAVIGSILTLIGILKYGI